MHRRQFLQATGLTTGLALLGSLPVGIGASAQSGYGSLGAPDANGLQLPAGFQSRVVAITGQPVGATGYPWHPNPDGGATFAQPDGGWVYVSNNETPNLQGGASMVRFDADAAIVDARPILSGTNFNCAGGSTPWGTWLSCEEVETGRVWECDPLGVTGAVARPAMGTFAHEAAAADPKGQVIYLTEDQFGGALYRFTPTVWGDLSSGVLECMTEDATGLGWAPIPDPTAAVIPTRQQVPTAKAFAACEGAWFEAGLLYFTTKVDNRVWCYDPALNELNVIYDIATSPTPVLSGVDNITVSAAGELFVCEDGGNMEVVVLRPDGGVEPFVRMNITGSEVTGAAFDPSGTRLYVSSQRNPGVTFEITGPFNQPCNRTVGLGFNCADHDFVDVPASAYYAEAVAWAACMGVTTGTTATTFSPDDPVTRAQVATFLWRYGTKPVAGPHPFTDVPDGTYYSDPVKWLAESQITTGTTATTFSPFNVVTRAQMATFLWRFECEPAAASSGFVDVPGDAFYTDAVNWMAATGVTNGTSATTFSPTAALTRAQAVTFLWRLENLR